jgi:hypothetical protein
MVSVNFCLTWEVDFHKNGHRAAKNSFIFKSKSADFNPKSPKNALF